MKNKIFHSITFLLTVSVLGGCVFNNQKSNSNHHFTEKFLFDDEKHWKECTDEGCVQTIETAIHEYLDWTVIEEPTCSKPGKEQSKCSTCDFVLTRDVPVVDHEVNFKWTIDSSSHWHTCSNNAEEKVDFGNHAFKWVYSKEPNCVESGKGYQECSVCGYKLEEVDAKPLGHDWEIDEEDTTYATCFTSGVVTHKCKACGAKSSEVVAAGHAWMTPEYEWNEELTKVTATRICANNPEHVETETVKVNKSHLSPTCSALGNDTYTTTAFANSAFEVQQKVIELAKCSETLVLHCDAEKYVAGSVYEECSVCHTKYNERELNAPWADFYFPTQMEKTIEGVNGLGDNSHFDVATKEAKLAKTSTKGAPLQFVSENPVEKSVGKNYFVMTYTLVENSSGTVSYNAWWDTYLTIAGYGASIIVRFGRIDASAVRAYDMDKATFFMNDEVVGWNGVDEIGKTGTVMIDMTGLVGGVSSISLQSDGGAKLRIESAEFRSSKCEHDVSCFGHYDDTTCAGLISTNYDKCDVCEFVDNEVVSELPTGYQNFNVATPLGVRGDSNCYDNKNHIVTLPNTGFYGPMFNNVNGTKMLVEFSLNWDDEKISNPSNAKFALYFMNSEATMYSSRYIVYSSVSGLSSDIVSVDNPANVNTIAKLLNNKTGEQISSFARREKVVLELNISNPSIKNFPKFIITGSNGSIVTIHNFIYC